MKREQYQTGMKFRVMGKGASARGRNVSIGSWKKSK